jgi:hypothetical protein
MTKNIAGDADHLLAKIYGFGDNHAAANAWLDERVIASVMAKSKRDVLDEEDDGHRQRDDSKRGSKRPHFLLSAQERAALDLNVPKRRKELDAVWIEYHRTLKYWTNWSHDLIWAPGAPAGLRDEEWKAVCADEQWLDLARFTDRNTGVSAPTFSIEIEGLGRLPI